MTTSPLSSFTLFGLLINHGRGGGGGLDLVVAEIASLYEYLNFAAWVSCRFLTNTGLTRSWPITLSYHIGYKYEMKIILVKKNANISLYCFRIRQM